jgi:MFS family permease
MFVVQLDFFALNLALPRMAEDLDVSTTDLQWVVSGNMLALAALLIFGGRVGDIFGRARRSWSASAPSWSPLSSAAWRRPQAS